MTDGPMHAIRALQARASDPAASAWVAANAGTGKTYVLVERILRLLLSGTEPARILCLTYTKAAAAEMSSRLYDRLGRWATAPVGVVGAELEKLLGRLPEAGEERRARTLFAHAIETPGGLKIETIHGFAGRMLQRFPLEASVPPGFEILDAETKRALLAESVEATLSRAASGEDAALARALGVVAAHAADTRFDVLMAGAERLTPEIRRLVVAADDVADPFGSIRRDLLHRFGMRPDASLSALEEEMAGVLSDALVASAIGVLETGGANERKAAVRLRAVAGAEGAFARGAALQDFFLTKEGEPRAHLLARKTAEAHPVLSQRLSAAGERHAALTSLQKALQVVEASVAFLRLAEDVLAGFAERKAARAALDFDDLIAAAETLLGRSSDAQWVLYKLDGGLDHILLDEAQDTAPDQWSIVAALAAEFHAGAGASETLRTVFAVGDEKQSIFGFQGAAPRMFAAMERRFAEAARAAGRDFHSVPLTMSFRSAEPVLRAVDRVFADAARVPGLTARPEPIRHQWKRSGAGGLVEIWPTEAAEETPPADAFAPLEDLAGAAPVERLAERIARCIGRWLEVGERLASEDRPLTPGDILILVRRRNPFAPAMIKALKAHGIRAAGADRIRVLEQIAVEDLVALGRVLLLPEDDLSLAAVLKSPLLGLDDDDLLAIGHGRRGPLWAALLEREALGPERLAAAARTLKRWRARADFLPPFELYSAIVDREGVRGRMLGRLGAEAGDAIDEFLSLAIRYDSRHPPSLEGFLDWLGHASPEIRRDMEQGRDEVRVMTVHGAKGLEAPVVFLADTCSTRSSRAGGLLMPLEAREGRDKPAPQLVWPIKGASRLAPLAERLSAEAKREREEHHRLLYVAMTRARDRLYVTGFEGAKGREAGCWYDLVAGALAGELSEVEAADGGRVRRLEKLHEGPPEVPRRAVAGVEDAVALPGWALRPAPREAERLLPVRPSRLAPLDGEEASGTHAEPSIIPPRSLAGGSRFLRGTLTHALLQHLPALPPAERRSAAQRFLASPSHGISPELAADIVRETLAVLEDRRFAALFAPGSRAEVPIAAEIPREGRAPLIVTGEIDRLAVHEREVLLVDFKTNRPPPTRPEEIPRAYLLQLAAYRLALVRIYEGRAIVCALLWTDGARLMEVPRPMLDAAERELMTGLVG